MDFNGIRRLYLPLRPKARFSPGRKTQGQGYRPSAGLRPLNVSRVKCVGGPCRGHCVFPAGRPPHLTRETFSGRRPVDGADTLGGVFRPGENLTLGAEGKIKSADAA